MSAQPELEFDWAALWAALEPLPSDTERDRAWQGHGKRWLTRVIESLGGEFALHGGGYPHFVFPHYDQFHDLERVMSHELTHALVSHLPLPLWLNEGIAVTMEEAIAGGMHARRTVELLDQHPDFWNEETMQEFWSGASFSRPDEGNGLSYGLAHLLTANLAHDFDRFRGFALAAHAADAGESAAREHLGISLGHMVGALLGEGDWEPQPERWTHETQAQSPE